MDVPKQSPCADVIGHRPIYNTGLDGSASASLPHEHPGGFVTSRPDARPSSEGAGSTAPVSAVSEDPLGRGKPAATGTDFDQIRNGLVHLARRVCAELPNADVAAAVDAGMLVAAREGSDRGEAVAAATAHAAARIQRQAPAPGSTLHVDWAGVGLGAVIPVVPASPGAGASVVAAVLADAVALLGWRVLLADTADPARSGLLYAARSEGPSQPGPDEAVRLRLSWRDQAMLARPETRLPILAPGMVPPPPFWAPPQQLGAVQVTVADVSYDAWRMAAQPMSGPGQWLRVGKPQPRPVLVVRPSRMSLRHAEQVLTRLEAWTTHAVAASPAALAVVGATRWPAGVVGAAGRRVTALLDRTVFIPYDSTVDSEGITPETTPVRLREGLAPLLRAWGLASAQDLGGRLFKRGRR